MINGIAVQMTAAEETAFNASRAPGKNDIKRAVVELMISKQDGGIILNGTFFSTDAAAKSDIAGAKLKAMETRKIVTRKGDRTTLNSTGIDALFDAIETYRQSVMNRAHDLLAEIDAAEPEQLTSINIKTDWPTTVIS